MRYGDLLFGSTNSQIATLIERQSRYLMLTKVASKDTATVVSALIKQAHKLPHELYKSLTWDRGKEIRFTLATDVKGFFCDPQSPWQLASNENTNGPLRQYLSKGLNLSGYSQSKLNAIARRLNERPIKTRMCKNRREGIRSTKGRLNARGKPCRSSWKDSRRFRATAFALR